METIEAFEKIAIALGLGLLVGFQRQRSDNAFAGIRTFPVFALMGAICALTSQELGGWVFGAGLLALASIVALGKWLRARNDGHSSGVITEASALLMYLICGYLVVGHVSVAVAATGVVAILLQYKGQMHRFAESVNRKEIDAVMQFVLISLVIFPALPNRSFDPYGVLNPHKIWFVVVLIVGISLLGYVAFRLFGGRAGALLGGILGGVVSSTATTVSYARRSAHEPQISAVSAVVLAIASAVGYIRLIVEVGVLAPTVLPQLIAPLATMAGFMALISVIGYLLVGKKDAGDFLSEGDPIELKYALVFALLFAIILLIVAMARDRFGREGLYAVSVISGLIDVDVITLSTATLVNQGKLDSDAGWRAILIASLSNLFFKGGLAALLGTRQLAKKVSVLFGVGILFGVMILVFWPSP